MMVFKGRKCYGDGGQMIVFKKRKVNDRINTLRENIIL